MLPCFSPANIELFIATNSPDDSLLLSWVHSHSLPSDSDKLSTSTLLSILHLSRVKNDATVTWDQITALTELRYSKLCEVNSL